MTASPADGTTTLNGLRFHFLDWGTRGEPPMLLLHGGAQTAHSWDEVAPDLARDHYVLALDQRGHGDTDWAPEGRYRRDDFVADIRAFLDDRDWERATGPAVGGGGGAGWGPGCRESGGVGARAAAPGWGGNTRGAFGGGGGLSGAGQGLRGGGEKFRPAHRAGAPNPARRARGFPLLQ